MREAPARPRGRPSVQTADHLTQTIVETALKEFKRRGFEATTVDAIASACRTSKHTIYRRFPGKEALFKAALERDRQRISDRIGEIDLRTGDVLDRLRAAAQAIFEIASSKGSTDLYRVCIGAAPRFPAIGDQFAASIDLICGIYADLISKAQGEGRIRKGEAELLARQLHYTTVGQIWGQALLGERHIPMEAERQALFEANWRLFLSGVRG